MPVSFNNVLKIPTTTQWEVQRARSGWTAVLDELIYLDFHLTCIFDVHQFVWSRFGFRQNVHFDSYLGSVFFISAQWDITLTTLQSVIEWSFQDAIKDATILTLLLVFVGKLLLQGWEKVCFLFSEHRVSQICLWPNKWSVYLVPDSIKELTAV